MTASRLLILGALRRIQPAHGYQVRQELERWEADQWANIAYGSIYHALNTMTQEGLLNMHVETERKGGSTKKMYALTPDGEKEYRHLLSEYWWEPKVVYDPFQIALLFASDLPRSEYREALEMRRGLALETIQHLEERRRTSSAHVQSMIDLSLGQLRIFVKWTDEQIAK